MAKKPDFTQKLLGDLRMRKEHMVKSQNSNRSDRQVTERYRDFKHPYRESREIVSTSRDIRKWSGKSNQSLDMGESSRQLVPVGRTRNSEQIADFSMALAFALQNGRDFRTRSSGNIITSYLNHLDKTRPSNGQFPTLSHLHIKEISRGAQKLNQILKACYNGLNFDVYSMDIGTELLKGALDLEESLKMLIGLQEASEYMVKPRKQQHKIRLLEMDDNDDESNLEANKKKQIGLPRFSFDKPSKRSTENTERITKNSTVKQKPLAISYHTETRCLNSEKQTPSTSKLICHKKSASCGAESSKSTSLSIIKKQPNWTESQSERGRIPNIIAKLMGLEELPPNKESIVPPHKEPHVKQDARGRNEIDRNPQRSGKKGEHLSIDFKKPAQQIAKQKLAQAEKLSTVPDNTSLVVYVGKMTPNPPETEVAEGKVHLDRKKTEGTCLMSNSTKSAVKFNKPEITMAQSRLNKDGSLEKLENKRKQENPTPKKQMKNGRAEAIEEVLKDVVQKVDPETHKNSETAKGKIVPTRTKKDAPSKEQRFANNKLLRACIHEKPPLQSHPAKISNKPNFQDAKLQRMDREQKKVIKDLAVRSNNWEGSQKKLLPMNQVMSSKKNPTAALHTMHSKRSAESKNKEDVTREDKMRKSPNQNLAEQRPSARDSKTDGQNVAAPITHGVTRKPPHAPLAEKVNNTDICNEVTPRGIKEGTVRENNFASELLKEQTSIAEVPLYNPKTKVRASKEADLSLNRSKEAGALNQLLNSAQAPQIDVDCSSIISTPMGEVYPRLNDFETSSITTNQDRITTVSNSQNPSAISPHEHQIRDNVRNISETSVPSTASPIEEVLISSNSESIQIKEYQDEKVLSGSKSFQHEPHKLLERYKPKQLTEKEKHLKQILVNSQMFLNAAEALFGLLIPVEMLQYSDNKYSDDDNKLALDCAYEMMKRKGRRHEFMFHPWAKHCSGTLRMRCLDDLVKDLHEDLKTLCPEHDAADSLHDLLQKDLQNNKPDMNSMWDLEWGAAMFAHTEKEEVAKDIEKHVLNGLLDEFTRDMLQLTTVA